MRNRFDEQLNLLNKKMIEMSAMCETLIAKTYKALENTDAELAGQVVADSSGIDQSEKEIEGLCIKLLLQQQPVAKDLRQISAALKMVTDIQRIGNQAEDIAEIIPFLQGHTIDDCSKIKQMADATIKMVTDSVNAYVKKDVDLACQVIEQDDTVDSFFLDIKNLLISLIAENPDEGEFALDIFMISKYFERIGDHAVNIANWVIYSVNGDCKGDT